MIDERKDKLGEQSEEQVNIQELLFRYLIHWPWFVVSIIISIACAWGYLRLTTPIYNISATVLIKDEKKGGGASMSSDLEKMGLEGFVSSSSNVDNEIEVLRSKSLAREVVNNLGLFVTYMDEDEFPSKELYHTSPVLVSLTHQEADKLPGRMEINMILQPTGALGVQITVGEKEYRKQFDKLPAVFPTDEGTIAFFANNDTLSAVCPENITKERHITAFINRPFSVLKEYVNSLSIAPTSKTTSVVVISLENIHHEWDSDKAVYVASVCDIPRVKGKTIQAAVNVEKVKDVATGSWKPVNKQILLYWMPDSMQPPLQCGDRMCYRAHVGMPMSDADFTGFDYGQYLQRQGISGTAIVYSGYWRKLLQPSTPTFKMQALMLREQIVKKFRTWNLEDDVLAIISALTVGD